MTLSRLFSLPLLAALAGCSTVGPDYEVPRSQVADTWLEPADTSAIDPVWWRQFDDRILVDLVERAIQGSPTIEQAEARLAEARANREAVRGRRLPELKAQGSATENRISENGQIPAGRIPGFDTEFSLFDLGFDASWEIDFWGRRIREDEAASAREGAAEARLQDALVMLTGEIARSYMDLREAQASISVFEKRTEALGQLARLTRLRFQAGESSKIEADRAIADAAAAEKELANARTRESAAAYRIAALLGEAPEAIVPALREDAPIPQSPQTILVGLRSDLLRRRPDVRIAERELAAATADIGVATADLFPRFSLMGGLGTQSRSVDGLFDPGSTRFSIGPSFSWPIFSGGRIRAQIRASDARADAAAARYDQAVAEALADSESAINRFLEARKAEQSARDAETSQANAFALSRHRFELGEDDRLALERAELELLSRRQALKTAEAETARAAVAVFKALGGGTDLQPPNSM